MEGLQRLVEKCRAEMLEQRKDIRGLRENVRKLQNKLRFSRSSNLRLKRLVSSEQGERKRLNIQLEQTIQTLKEKNNNWDEKFSGVTERLVKVETKVEMLEVQELFTKLINTEPPIMIEQNSSLVESVIIAPAKQEANLNVVSGDEGGNDGFKQPPRPNFLPLGSPPPKHDPLFSNAVMQLNQFDSFQIMKGSPRKNLIVGDGTTSLFSEDTMEFPAMSPLYSNMSSPPHHDELLKYMDMSDSEGNLSSDGLFPSATKNGEVQLEPPQAIEQQTEAPQPEAEALPQVEVSDTQPPPSSTTMESEALLDSTNTGLKRKEAEDDSDSGIEESPRKKRKGQGLWSQPHGVSTTDPSGLTCRCGSKMEKKKSLLEHIKYFTMEWKFKCQICHRLFPRCNILKKHERKFHGVDLIGVQLNNSIGCRYCGKELPSRGAHRRHLQLCEKRTFSKGTSKEGMVSSDIVIPVEAPNPLTEDAVIPNQEGPPPQPTKSSARKMKKELPPEVLQRIEDHIVSLIFPPESESEAANAKK